MASNTFSQWDMKYLDSLDAVQRVTSERIFYTDRFRVESLRRYLEGESPIKIFSEAGLDPQIIGYKRIERCFARWKEQAERAGMDTTRSTVRPAGRQTLALMDVRDATIAKQAMRIYALEEKVQTLEKKLQSKDNHGNEVD